MTEGDKYAVLTDIQGWKTSPATWTSRSPARRRDHRDPVGQQDRRDPPRIFVGSAGAGAQGPAVHHGPDAGDDRGTARGDVALRAADLHHRDLTGADRRRDRPGGKIIKKIQADTGAKIDIEQSGKVYIACADAEGGERARKMIDD